MTVIRMVWRITSMLLLVAYVFSAGGQGGQLVLCVPTEGTAAVEFVSPEPDSSGTTCQHEKCGSIVACIGKAMCDDHPTGCVDIPLSIATTAVPIKSLRAQALRPLFVGCPLPLTETVAAPAPFALLPATLPPHGGGFLPSLRTVVLRT